MDALRTIYEIGYDRDGYTSAEKLGRLVDELVEIAKCGMKGQDFIFSKNIRLRSTCSTAKDALVGILPFCEEDEICATAAYKSAIDKVREAIASLGDCNASDS